MINDADARYDDFVSVATEVLDKYDIALDTLDDTTVRSCC